MINIFYLAAMTRPVDDGGGGSAAPAAGSFNFISNNNSAPTKIIYEYISAFGGIIIAFALIMLGIKMLLSAHKKDARAKAMEALGKLVIGGFIIGASLILAGYISHIANQSGIILIAENPKVTAGSAEGDGDTNGSFVINAVAGVIDAIPNAIFNLISDGFGFQSLDNLIFNTSTSDTSMPPFKDDEWHNLNFLYICICTIVAPLILIMIAKTGIEMVLYSDSTSKKIDLKEEISRWILCAFLLGTAPFLMQGLFRLFNAFTDSLGLATASLYGSDTSSGAVGKGFAVKTFEDLKTGSVLTTAIVHLLYAWEMVKINLVFLSRKVVLATMYAFTPIAIALWGINKKVNAASIWFGEIITNAAMQFFYAFTFTVMMVAVGSSWNNWLLTLIWMAAIIKVADMLRNSLQGLFTKLAGIDEASLAGGVFGTVGSAFAGLTAAFGMAASNSGFKGGSVRDKVFGETMSKGNGKNDKGGEAINTNSANGGPDVASANSSPIGAAQASGTTPPSSPPKAGNGSASYSAANASTPKEKGGTGAMPDYNNSPAAHEENAGMDLPPSVPPETKDGSNTNGSGDNKRKAQDPAVTKFKQDSSKQALYNSMLADNLNREMSNPNRRNASGALMGAMTMNDPMMKGLIKGVGDVTGGLQNRRATARAVNKTVEQMQRLSGTNKDGEYNISKKEALNTLFGGNSNLQANFKHLKFLNSPANKILNATANTDKGKNLRNYMNRKTFASNIAKGDNDSAAMNLAQAHPFNKLDSEEKTKIIAQTNPYTSMDGFNHWNS